MSRRVLLIFAGLALAGLAGWAVVELAGGPVHPAEPEIDDASRARLLEVLGGGAEGGRRGAAR